MATKATAKPRSDITVTSYTKPTVSSIHGTAKFLWKRVQSFLDYLEEMFTLHPFPCETVPGKRSLRVPAPDSCDHTTSSANEGMFVRFLLDMIGHSPQTCQARAKREAVRSGRC